MTPERWKRVEALYHAAQTQPPTERAAFLREACRGDEALRREVESLLNEPVSAPGFFDTPPAVMDEAFNKPNDLAPELMTGRTLGGYHLECLLGAGGMGEVYGARDAKLGRDVAIKILPGTVTSDPERLARFEREARMLAALNHPNICAIFGLEESNGVQFLVLERVDGTTLAQRIAAAVAAAGTGIAIDEALTIARQIAEALEAAHDKGIVHRDLKPANVNITDDGIVKLLDFGLAKPVAADGSTPDLTRTPTLAIGSTRDGVILGTAAYMSPEQARGKAIDKRTDIWAFGCVLYEMLTGRVPFAGETVSDTIGKILEREPDWSALPQATPVAVRRVLLRCFAKDPKQRLRDIGDIRIELNAINEQLPGVAVEATGTRPHARSAWLPWAALVLVAAAAGAWEFRRATVTRDDPMANAQFTRITDWDGTESGAEISPDGRFLVFVADKVGQFDIWMTQLGTGDFRNLTADLSALQMSGPIFRKFGFSGDGANIWFSPDTGPAMAQMIMPFLGGTPQAFLDRNATAPAWSPEGDRLAYFKNEDGDPLFVANRAGGDARQIFKREGMHNHNPVWSPDGEWIYFASGAEPTDAMNVWRVRPAGGSAEQLTTDATAVNFMAPLDARTMLYVGREEDRAGPWLWALDVEQRVTRRVRSGLGQYTSVSASRDGRRVVATVANPTSSLWRVPLLDHQAEERTVQSFPGPTGRALAPRFAGRSFFYLSSRGSGDGLWRFQDGQASEVWKGGDGRLSEPAAISPDGSRAAIILRQGGRKRLTLLSADGRGARTLAPSLDIYVTAGQSAADWSPDGKWLVVGGRDGEVPGLFKIAADTGESTRLSTGPASNPIWSPDGKLIVYSGKFFTGQAEILGVRPEDGAPIELPLARARPGGYRFLPGGAGLVYLQFIPSLDFWTVDFKTKTRGQLTALDNRGAIGTFDVTPDGKAIVFDRTRENSDIVLIERK